MTTKKALSAKTGVVIAAFCIAILNCNTADSADWKPYSENRHFYFYYNEEEPDSLKEILSIFKKRIVRVWAKRVTKNDKGRDRQIQENKKLGLPVKDYDQYEYTLTLKEINCSDKTIRSLSEADYTKEGDSLAKSESPFADWGRIVPASNDELLHKSVCVLPETEK